MSAAIKIRRASDEDRDFVAGLAISLLEFTSPAWGDPTALLPGFQRVLADAVTAPDPRAAVLIAEEAGGRRLGFISLTVRPDVAGNERAHVADLAVVEDCRRTGVGRALMQSAERWARERGLSMLSLDVWSTNEGALWFYRALGFGTESLCLIRSVD